MSELHTFYAPPEAFGETIVLQGQELKHLAQALRLKPGERCRVLDGQGRSAEAVIEAVGRREATLRPDAVEFTPKPASRAVVALALSKATRRGFFLEKAVELGAEAVWLWQGDFSQGKLPREEKDSWQAKMVAGIKQSGNPWLPQVRAFPEGIAGVIQAAAGFEHHLLPWEKQEGVPMLSLADAGLPGTTCYVVGPEGGFSDAELEALAEAGYNPVSFGRRILRCETAATLCLGIHWWASQQEGRPDFPPDISADFVCG